MSVCEEYALKFSSKRRTVMVSESAAEVWEKNKQAKNDETEMCGVLVGATSTNKKKIWIERVTSALPLDIRARNNYVLKDPGHQLAIDEAHLTSGGTEIYLGTWHTHPEDYPIPSSIDKTDWRKCMRRNRARPLVFVIVGRLETRLFYSWAGSFRQIAPVQL